MGVSHPSSNLPPPGSILPATFLVINLAETPAKEGKAMKERISKLASKVEEEEFDGDSYEVIFLTDPGNYRQLDELVRMECKGKGRLEVLDLKEAVEGDETIT